MPQLRVCTWQLEILHVLLRARSAKYIIFFFFFKTEPLRSKTRGRKIFFSSFRIPDWVKKLNWQRLTGEKCTHLIEFLHVHGSLHKRMKTQRSVQSRKLVYSETSNKSVKDWQVKRLELGVIRASQVVLVVGEPACQCRKHKRFEFNPWIGKIPWKRAW